MARFFISTRGVKQVNRKGCRRPHPILNGASKCIECLVSERCCCFFFFSFFVCFTVLFLKISALSVCVIHSGTRRMRRPADATPISSCFDLIQRKKNKEKRKLFACLVFGRNRVTFSVLNRANGQLDFVSLVLITSI